jgi:hypothetical protein
MICIQEVHGLNLSWDIDDLHDSPQSLHADVAINLAMTVSFHNVSNSVFIIIQSFDIM